MKIGFDLDGTLDRPAVLALAHALHDAGHTLYILTGRLPETGELQDMTAKVAKLARMGLASVTQPPTSLPGYSLADRVILRVFHASSRERVPSLHERLWQLAVDRGLFVEQEGIEIVFDDSRLNMRILPSACGAQLLHVR